MKYAIEYEQMKDELIKNDRDKAIFDLVKNSANKWELELTDAEFNSFFKIAGRGKDID